LLSGRGRRGHERRATVARWRWPLLLALTSLLIGGCGASLARASIPSGFSAAPIMYSYDPPSASTTLAANVVLTTAAVAPAIPGSSGSPVGALRWCVAAEEEAGALPPIAGGAPTAAETFGGEANLLDHFTRHGADFGATSAEDYADQAQSFLARRGSFQQLVDDNGVTRVYDPETNTFGSYNANGTTRTFFKPDPTIHGYPTNQDYFDAQPGSAP